MPAWTKPRTRPAAIFHFEGPRAPVAGGDTAGGLPSQHSVGLA